MSRKENAPAKRESAEVAAQPHRHTVIPLVDVYETEAAVVLVADMPGVDSKSLDIRLEGQDLSIRGTCPPSENGQSIHGEYPHGDYARDFTISHDIDGDKISAAMANGVLTLTLPKSDRARTRKISVVAG